MNPLLNRIQFFRGAEALVAAVRPEWLSLEERELFVANVKLANASSAVEAAGPTHPL
jgi:hypothetical protein